MRLFIFSWCMQTIICIRRTVQKKNVVSECLPSSQRRRKKCLPSCLGSIFKRSAPWLLFAMSVNSRTVLSPNSTVSFFWKQNNSQTTKRYDHPLRLLSGSHYWTWVSQWFVYRKRREREKREQQILHLILKITSHFPQNKYRRKTSLLRIERRTNSNEDKYRQNYSQYKKNLQACKNKFSLISQQKNKHI